MYEAFIWDDSKQQEDNQITKIKYTQIADLKYINKHALSSHSTIFERLTFIGILF